MFKSLKRGCPRCLPPHPDWAKTGYKMTSWTLQEFKGYSAKQLPNANAYLKSFKQIRPLRYGMLTRCKKCHEQWYRHQDGINIEWVSPDRQDILGAWDQVPQAISDEHLQVLLKIRSAYREPIICPCVAEINGKVIDRCCVQFQNSPPLSTTVGRTHLFSEVNRLGLSKKAAPASLRLAWWSAHDVAHGTPAAMVEDSSGQVRSVHARPLFVVNSEDSRKQFKASKQPFEWAIPVVGLVPADEITWIIADKPLHYGPLILEGVPERQAAAVSRVGTGQI
ncbi:MAG: hypothetical protein AAGH99_13710 [Planctomycetota bacterium]